MVERQEKQRLTYNLQQAAEEGGISLPTMRALAHRADFPAFRVGRRWIIPVEDFMRWLSEQAEKRARL